MKNEQKKLPGFIRPVNYSEYCESIKDYIGWGNEMSVSDIKEKDLQYCWNNNYGQNAAYNYIVWGN